MPGLILDYVNSYLANRYFDDLLQTSIKVNEFCEEFMGFKVDFRGYEHFGKKNKYKRQQMRHLTYKLRFLALYLVGFALATITCIVLSVCKCACWCLCDEKEEKRKED